MRSSNKSRRAQPTVTPVSAPYTGGELVKMLSECRLKKKEALITQREYQCDIRPTLLLQLDIEGVSAS